MVCACTKEGYGVRMNKSDEDFFFLMQRYLILHFPFSI